MMKMNDKLQHRNWISRMALAAASALPALAAVVVLAAITTQSAQAQFTTLASFDGTNGSYPLAPLVQATDGNLYGTTNQVVDGSGYGTIFRISTDGTLTSLYSFCPGGPPPNGFCANGDGPVAGLVQATNGYLYGTTEYGGKAGGESPFGTVFRIDLGGDLTTLASLLVDDGCAPLPTAGLVQATNGNLYGATECGGVNGSGTLFKITSTQTAKLTTIYNFCANPSNIECDPTSISEFDGYDPVAGLIQATNGLLYGTTAAGGINGGGTVFQVSLAGQLTVLYRFCSQVNGDGFCTDGYDPASTLVQANNGNLYGTTAAGGTNNYGTVFEITPGGQLTTLYSFCSQPHCTDGINGGNPAQPALIQGTDGNLYGTTPYGGNTTSGVNTNGWGTIFQITPSGALTTLYTFCEVSGCPDGGEPYGGLVQNTNGNFYGTTSIANGTVLGTVFSLSMGLGPFIEIRPASSKPLATVNILGTDLTGATSVTFNGKEAAAFTVVSSSNITATIPASATTGFVTVTTPSGTLTSNVPEIVGGKLASTATKLSSSPNPSTSGEAVTFTAVVTSAAGVPSNGDTVSFMKGTTVLGTGTLSSGSASFTTSALPVGSTTVKAVYGGDAYFSGSKSVAVKQRVE